MKTNIQKVTIVIDPCANCGNPIAPIRREALPHTSTCVNCSSAKSYVGFMDWNHKTAPEIVLINPDDKENLRRAKAINERKR